jgi:hypothetical protein
LVSSSAQLSSIGSREHSHAILEADLIKEGRKVTVFVVFS